MTTLSETQLNLPQQHKFGRWNVNNGRRFDALSKIRRAGALLFGACQPGNIIGKALRDNDLELFYAAASELASEMQ